MDGDHVPTSRDASPLDTTQPKDGASGVKEIVFDLDTGGEECVYGEEGLKRQLTVNSNFITRLMNHTQTHNSRVESASSTKQSHLDVQQQQQQQQEEEEEEEEEEAEQYDDNYIVDNEPSHRSKRRRTEMHTEITTGPSREWDLGKGDGRSPGVYIDSRTRATPYARAFHAVEEALDTMTRYQGGVLIQLISDALGIHDITLRDTSVRRQVGLHGTKAIRAHEARPERGPGARQAVAGHAGHAGQGASRPHGDMDTVLGSSTGHQRAQDPTNTTQPATTTSKSKEVTVPPRRRRLPPDIGKAGRSLFAAAVKNL